MFTPRKLRTCKAIQESYISNIAIAYRLYRSVRFLFLHEEPSLYEPLYEPLWIYLVLYRTLFYFVIINKSICCFLLIMELTLQNTVGKIKVFDRPH